MRSKKLKNNLANRYLKIVEWSDEDQCYVGRVPGLFLGGVHGDDEIAVYKELTQVVEEWLAVYARDHEPLPPATNEKSFSGKFNLRVDPKLHQRLAVRAKMNKQSLNNYVATVLQANA